MITDPIADLLTRIRNAVQAKQQKTIVPHSKLKVSILGVLKKNGYIEGYKIEKQGVMDEIMVELKPDISSLHLKRVSSPGQRIYIKQKAIKPVLNGYGIAILSTPKGVMTEQDARKNGVGGEVLCEVWK